MTLLPQPVVQYRRIAAKQNPAAQRQHRFHCALAEESGSFRQRVHGGQPHAICVEWDLVQPRAGRGLGQDPPSHFDQRDLHRIAQEGRTAQLARLSEVVTQLRRQEEGPVRLCERASRLDRSRRIHRVPEEQLSDRHAILSQRSGLVGADHRGRAERLDRRQVADQHAPTRHTLGGEYQRKRQRR